MLRVYPSVINSARMFHIRNNCSISGCVISLSSLFFFYFCHSHESKPVILKKKITFEVSCSIGFPQFQEIYRALTSQTDYNVTLPMILSEWHKLYNLSRFEVWMSRLPAELGATYWINWMPNTTHDVSGTLLQRFALNLKSYVADMYVLSVAEHPSAANNSRTGWRCDVET